MIHVTFSRVMVFKVRASSKSETVTIPTLLLAKEPNTSTPLAQAGPHNAQLHLTTQHSRVYPVDRNFIQHMSPCLTVYRREYDVTLVGVLHAYTQ